MEHLVTNTPTALANLSPGAEYSLQNSHGDSYRVLRFAIKQNVADVGGGAGLAFLQGTVLTVGASEACFVWHVSYHDDFLCTYERAS